jgi:polyribonucleotide nucleotidyltransferase
LAIDADNTGDVPALIGASAALCLSDIPYFTPVAGVKIGYIDGEYIINPTYEQLKVSQMDLFVAGTDDAVCMVESSAKELSEEIMIKAIETAHDEIKKIIEIQKILIKEAGKQAWEFTPAVIAQELINSVEAASEKELSQILHNPIEKKQREILIDSLRDKVIQELTTDLEDAVDDTVTQIKTIFHDLEKKIVRAMILDENVRVDGRKPDEIRQITSEVSFLPRVHGSALFTRGQTQSLGTCTLGSSRDSQRIDTLMEPGETREPFMLHYNFPPYATGECKFLRGPGRREIGHGNLAHRALAAVLPDQVDFPYTIRIVSEILESNGSSSQATICSGSLSLMDAGVPITNPVSGIAMGLIKEGDKFAILSDILGMEDHLGDMDFKVAGTVKGVTALQMDIKIKGLSYDIITKALAQAHKGRLHILDKMAEALSESRKELSPDAPRIYALKINPEKIGTVIGPGGKTIRSITSETGVEMDIEEDGTVRIFTMDAAMADKALKMVSDLTAEVEVGKIYEGTVVRVVNFGCFVQILPGKDGLVHISELEQGRVNQVTDVCDVGDKITVKVMAIDEMGRVNLSRRACLPGYVDTGEDKPRRERSNDRPPRRDNNRNHSNSRRN